MIVRGSGGAAARWGAACILCAFAVTAFPSRAAAEKVLANVDNWQIYTDGRAGGFLSQAYGDGFPQPTFGTDAMGNIVGPIFSPQEGGGFRAPSDQDLINANPQMFSQGTIDMSRVRSGFVSNTFGFGVRGKLTEWTTVSTYVQLWAYIENDDRQKNTINFADMRQGFVKLEGPWGYFTVGRTRALFSRGNTDIDALYAHRWGVGFPGNIANRGPAAGQLGFGVLGVGFSSGIIYGTPSLGGLQLHVGLFDPVQLQGLGNWTRTQYARPEAELTFERPFRGGWGKVALFANGVYQKVYKDGYCDPMILEPVTMSYLPCDATVWGGAGGGRIELGRVRLGASGYYGQGLGLRYALEVSEAAQDRLGNLRKSGGGHVQLMVAMGKVDAFAGGGIALIDRTQYDRDLRVQDPRDPTNPAALVNPYTIIKHQLGFNAGAVYHVTPNLHAALDIFRAEAAWTAVNGFPGQKQVVWIGNAGLTANW